MDKQSSKELDAASKLTLLVLDDEVAIAELVSNIFETEGFNVLTFFNPQDALIAAQNEAIDLAIVDIMMPGMDGFEFCRRLRAQKNIPVVFLTAKDEETDVVVGFALGAEDYITKPFKPRELVARVKARLRKHEELDYSLMTQEVLTAQGIKLDKRAHTAHLHDLPLTLTPKEFSILAFLLQNKGKPVSSRELYEEV